jgi:hypothetical protein
MTASPGLSINGQIRADSTQRKRYTDRLIHFLNLLGRDVEIVVKLTPRSRRVGQSCQAAAQW